MSLPDLPYGSIIDTANRITTGRTFKENLTIFSLLLVILAEFFYLNARSNEIKDSINYILNFWKLNLVLPDFLVLFLISLLIFYISVFFLLIIDFINDNRSYIWKHDRLLKDWEFQGSITLEKDGSDDVINIKSSEIGAIIRNRSWKNFALSFEFKIPKKISYGQSPNENQLERGFGLIYRAKDLNQYYMLKIDKTGYLPHIKNFQYWENMGPTVTIKKLNSSVLDSWVKAIFVMKENVLSVTIGGDKFKIFLPSYSIVSRKDFPDKTGEKEYEPYPFAPIKYSSGTVGFRSYPLEEVFIKNFKVVSNHVLFRIGRKIKIFKKALNVSWNGLI